ncbi:MAG: hypothetical protein JST06_11905 [Bacteroidetes bacterium]|nr:hypothetical protein [Bacteroidota bacterium]MBS1630854.1 hypothetical protein [Bacteroidota bacterium]
MLLTPPMPPTLDERFQLDGFAGSTNEFFAVVRRLLELALNRPRALSLPGNEQLRHLVQDIFRQLSKERLYAALAFALADLDAEDEGSILLLQQEMDYMSARYADVHTKADLPDDELEDGLDNVETGKGSFEELVEKLPKWLKKLLKILNEVLKIVKTVI